MSTLDTNRIEYEQALAALLDAYGGSTSTGTISSSRLSLINYVKSKLDEVIPEGEGIQFIAENDTNISDPLNLLINAVLDEATKRVLLHAPISVLKPMLSNEDALPDPADSKIGKIYLPDNFLRFVSLKMADWRQQAVKAISIDDPLYQQQGNEFVRGGTDKPVVVLRTSPVGYGTAVAQVDELTISGEDNGNQGLISCAGLEFEIIFDDDLETTADDFVDENEDDFAAVGVTVTSSGATIRFTASEAGTPFTHPEFYKTDGDDFEATIVNVTANRLPYTYYKVLEYYSVMSSHVIDWLYYIPETLAEDLQSNLHDALSWMAAGMILQITERVDLAKIAFEQEAATYQNIQ